ncbi:MAG TPA: hypothetical protein VFN76_11115 [Candidatus Limnocylindria bacterium]|nr:hypothetical protein [Candidatus Limnocylindria bacterium]
MRACLVLLLVGVLSGCATAQPIPSSAPPTPASPAGPLEPLPPFPGYSATDTRLRPIYAELRAHPEWLDEPFGNAVVLGLVPSLDRMCLALRGTEAGDLFVTIDPGGSWAIETVAIDRGDEGREITYDTTGLADDVCPFVILGRRDPWPTSEAAIQVTGNVAPDEARAIARAAFVEPEALGLDRHGIPAISVGDPVAGGVEGWNCRAAIVYVGGPRSEVVIGTRPDGAGGFHVAARLVTPATPLVGAESAC